MTISVRLSEKLEESLRKDAKLEGKNISEIVNQALEKYQNEYKYFDSINATFMDPSTNVCNIFNPKPLMEFTHLAWLQIGLASVLRWRHRHGAVIDDTTRVYCYWVL